MKKVSSQVNRQKKLALVLVALTATTLVNSASAINTVGGVGLENAKGSSPCINIVGGVGLE